ncbi:MAG: sodium:proton antiporter [Clostridia bacterium]|nr:sodium:proton antiporter [Clostridia bacterium]
MEQAYTVLFLILLFGLGLGILFALIRAIRGPRTADRIMGVNMIGTLSLLAITVLALFLKESWLLDVSLIYGLISFLAVAVLAMTRIRRRGGVDREPEDDRYE